MAELKAQYPDGCPTGGAVIMGAGRLTAKYVIHAVGPVYAGRPKDAELLASAYRTSLELCSRHGIQSEEAAPIAIRTVADVLGSHRRALEAHGTS